MQMNELIDEANFIDTIFKRGNSWNDNHHFLGSRSKEKGYDFWLYQKKKKSIEVFEKISGDYDKMNSVISFNQHKKWRDDMMLRMAVRKGALALDVCCGTADWTIALAEAVRTDWRSNRT